MDTGELRMPLFAEEQAQGQAQGQAPVYQQYGQDAYGAAMAWIQPTAGPQAVHPVPEPAYQTVGYAGSGMAYEGYSSVPTTLTDGRPLFRDEEPWPGI